jgi:hypothetical protein
VIVVFGYLTFYVVSFTVYYARRARQMKIAGALAAVDLLAALVFGPLLGWI